MKLSTLKADALAILKTPFTWSEFGMGILMAIFIMSSGLLVTMLLVALFTEWIAAVCTLVGVLLAIACAKYMNWKYN